MTAGGRGRDGAGLLIVSSGDLTRQRLGTGSLHRHRQPVRERNRRHPRRARPEPARGLRWPPPDGFAILDGTLIATDRITADEPYYSMKHRRHRMNVHVVAAPDGTPLWFSRALPGRTHDLTAARAHGVMGETTPTDKLRNRRAELVFLGLENTIEHDYAERAGTSFRYVPFTGLRRHRSANSPAMPMPMPMPLAVARGAPAAFTALRRERPGARTSQCPSVSAPRSPVSPSSSAKRPASAPPSAPNSAPRASGMASCTSSAKATSPPARQPPRVLAAGVPPRRHAARPGPGGPRHRPGGSHHTGRTRHPGTARRPGAAAGLRQPRGPGSVCAILDIEGPGTTLGRPLGIGSSSLSCSVWWRWGLPAGSGLSSAPVARPIPASAVPSGLRRHGLGPGRRTGAGGRGRRIYADPAGHTFRLVRH